MTQANGGDVLVKPPIKRGLYLLIIVIFVLMYWVFAHFIENIDLSASVNGIWHGRFPNAFDLPNGFIIIMELLHPRVWRHLIPLAVGWWLARLAAGSLVRTLYDLPDNAEARQFLSCLITGNDNSSKPLKVSSSTLESQRKESFMLRVGGPGFVLIPEGEVAVTEVNGRYYRILTAGKKKLKPFEYVHKILSLRTQERLKTGVPLTTKDGINLSAEFTVTFHIDTGGELPSRAKPFPFSQEAVELAAYNNWNKDAGVTHWDAPPVGMTTGNLIKAVKKYTLDELLHPQGHGRDPHYNITQEVERNVRGGLENIGIALESVHISRLELPEEIATQYIEYWKAGLEMQTRLASADAEAKSLEERELARAEAEVIMIQAIMEGLHNARRAGGANSAREMIALRFIEAIEKMARQSQGDQPLPATLLPQIESIRQQLNPDRQLAAGDEEDAL
jgi:regulator of protease activity HflC (stomatin/prohibitin superfamily)